MWMMLNRIAPAIAPRLVAEHLGQTLRSTVESALRRLVAEAQDEANERRRRITEHLARAGTQVDTAILLSDQAWQ